MEHKPIRYYLQEALQREDDQEDILQTFLQQREQNENKKNLSLSHNIL